jgi:hypothetical protein
VADSGSKSLFQIITMTRDDAAPSRFAGSSCSPDEDHHPPTPTTTQSQSQGIAQHDNDDDDAAAFSTASSSSSHYQLPERAVQGQGQAGMLSMSLIAHIQLFLKLLFPIMPVVDGDELLADAARLEGLPPSRYALILALCAATRMQLRMDHASISQGPPQVEVDMVDMPLEPELTGEILVSLAETSLRQYSAIDDTSLDSLLASFFLFASYGNLNKPRHAWFYLNQSISLAQSLDMTHETGYHHLPDIEQEKRRRVFWLLFVTER